MDLFFNTNPRFTKWLAKSSALHEPFVVVDVGVLGGENPRWHFLGDHLIVHGFDAIKEVIEDLSQKNAKSPNKSFHWLAIGNEDGERKFFFKPSNPTNSSFYEVTSDLELQTRTVPVRRLDTLFKQGLIPVADFLKVDVEGHERDVFLGASDLLGAGILGVESETSFDTSIFYPQTHFSLINGVLLKHGLTVVDLNFNRVRRSAYQEARRHRDLPELPIEGGGRPATLNVLFCRDLAAERNGSFFYEQPPPPPRVDQILKMLAIYELHGLNDIAVDIAVTYANELGQRLDVERVIDLLCREVDLPSARQHASPSSETANSIEARIEMSREHILALENERAALADQIRRLHASTSWRLTKPLRAIAETLKRSR